MAGIPARFGRIDRGVSDRRAKAPSDDSPVNNVAGWPLLLRWGMDVHQFSLNCFVASCKRLGGDPFAYLKDVLERLPTYSIDRLADLLPDAWFAAHPRAR